MNQNTQNFLDSVREYDKKTNEDQHSDTGTLWELLHWATEIIEKPPTVTIEVTGGVAHVTKNESNVDIEIIDHD